MDGMGINLAIPSPVDLFSSAVFGCHFAAFFLPREAINGDGKARQGRWGGQERSDSPIADLNGGDMISLNQIPNNNDGPQFYDPVSE